MGGRAGGVGDDPTKYVDQASRARCKGEPRSPGQPRAAVPTQLPRAAVPTQFIPGRLSPHTVHTGAAIPPQGSYEDGCTHAIRAADSTLEGFLQLARFGL